MRAVEFDSLIADGVIQIPKQYVNQVGKKVRVIILSEQMKDNESKINFSALSIDTKNFKFNREEANER